MKNLEGLGCVQTPAVEEQHIELTVGWAGEEAGLQVETRRIVLPLFLGVVILYASRAVPVKSRDNRS